MSENRRGVEFYPWGCLGLILLPLLIVTLLERAYEGRAQRDSRVWSTLLELAEKESRPYGIFSPPPIITSLYDAYMDRRISAEEAEAQLLMAIRTQVIPHHQAEALARLRGAGSAEPFDGEALAQEISKASAAFGRDSVTALEAISSARFRCSRDKRCSDYLAGKRDGGSRGADSYPAATASDEFIKNAADCMNEYKNAPGDAAMKPFLDCAASVPIR